MKHLAICLFFIFISFLKSQELSLNANNTSWYQLEARDSVSFPVDAQWQKVTPGEQFIIPPFPNTTGLSLDNFEIAKAATPRMLDALIYPPAGGTTRHDEREVSRFVEFVDEKARISDNSIEYLLDLEGQWTLDTKYRSSEWLIEFIGGHDNWLEVISDDKIIAEAKSQVILKGSDIPEKGQLQIRSSSWKKNNKGLIKIRVFKVYEKFISDQNRLGLKAILDSDISWKTPCSKSLQELKRAPEATACLYKRTYTCQTENDTKNIMVGASSDIQNVLINGHAIDLNSIIIPPQVFKKGANEVIYYSTKIQDSTHSNLTFTTFKPFFLKTTVKANENSIVKPMIRGARALVYINGSFAGLCQSEYAEALGYGLFQNGENEITLCLLQNSPQTFVESLNIATANDQHSLVLPWAKIKDDEKRPSFVFGPGPKQAYQGTLLSRTSKNDTFTAGLNLTATPNQDLQLTFNDSNRLSEWKFAQEFSAPYILYLNGKKILRKGASFTLPKELLSKTNNLRFESHGLKIPEPILYLKKAPTSPISPRLTLVKRRGQPRLNEETFFVGESLSWDLNFDPSSIDQVFISKNGIVTEIASKSLLQNPKIHLTLKNTEAIELKVWATQNDKEIFSFNRKILPVIFPKNPNGWLRAHGQNQIVSLSDQAFFESESNLFPEKFASEWLKRELYSDGDELQFGPLKEWSTKRKFSIYEFLPNGEAVFDKFYNRLNTYIKIQSRGLPTRFIMKSNTSAPELWKSAAFVFHYLKWLESQGQSVSWDLPTLEAYNTKYIAGLEAKAAEFVKIRKMTINNLVKQMTLTAALGSTFEEED